jgi:ubiquinone/menaquinone biosynthesis C-methylase UbiE
MSDKTSYMKSKKSLYMDNLVARMNSNEKFGESDFEEWVFSHINYPKGCELLDIACGTGKAIFKLLEKHPQIGSILAIDIFESALRILENQAKEENLTQVKVMVQDMETLPVILNNQKFDSIYSIYGIHYSPRMAELLCEYKPLLKSDGSIFFCGPDAFCNINLMRILVSSEVMDNNPIPTRMLKPFVSESDLKLLRKNFDKVEVDYFENPVHFPDLDSFLTWWRNHDLYRSELEDLLQQRVLLEIKKHDRFTLNKNIIGVKLTVDK